MNELKAIRFLLLSCLLTFVVEMHVLSQSYLLQQKFTGKFNEVSLFEALAKVSQQTKLHFSYDPLLVPQNTKYTLDLEQVSIDSLIKTLFAGYDFSIRVLEEQIIISKPQQTDNIDGSITVHPYIKLRGTVVEEKQLDPIPFATIALVGENLGSITNEEGRFVLKIPEKYSGDTLAISSIGFKTLYVPIERIDSVRKNYVMEMDLIPIQEVIIRKTEPLSLIRAANKAIGSNYSSQLGEYTCFYREVIKKNKLPVALSEAVLNLLKTPYDSESGTDMVKVFRSRKTINYTELDTVMLKLKGGIATSLALDFAKNSIDFIKEENYGLYDYNMSDIVVFDNRQAYVIEFDQKEGVKYPLFKGRVYIDVETMAYLGAEFGLSPKGLRYLGNTMVVRKSRRTKVKTLDAKYLVKYMEDDGTYYLNYIRFETRFKVRRKKQLFSTDFTTQTEMVVNKIEWTNLKKYRYRDLSTIDGVFMEEVGEYDADFWGPLNFIEPERSLENSVEEIARLLKNSKNK